MKKEATVIMLPTDKANTCSIVKSKRTGKLEPRSNAWDIEGELKGQLTDKFAPQHLYITDDSEIKEGDWCHYRGMHIGRFEIGESGNIRKIIATTDPELYYTQQNGHLGQAIIQVPQIPQSFIESYCKNPVDKVMVEYEELLGASNFPLGIFDLKIHPIEEKMYSETELIQFVLDNRFRIDSDTTRQEITNWIKK